MKRNVSKGGRPASAYGVLIHVERIEGDDVLLRIVEGTDLDEQQDKSDTVASESSGAR